MRRYCLHPALAMMLLSWAASLSNSPGEDRKNWIGGGDNPTLGQFQQTIPVVYPWTGVDDSGFLRGAVALPSCNPFITKSNQFTYAWLGRSASFVDIDGDGLNDIVSPDGNGMFWFWKNIGKHGEPVFGAGEVMPLLVDDLRSQFTPLIRNTEPEKSTGKQDAGLSPAQLSEKRRVDERREREFQQLKRKNDRAPKDKKRSEKDLRKEATEMFPYSWEQKPGDAPEDSSPIPAGRYTPGSPIPPGGLVATLNSFRRLRLVACPVDWNNDGATDFLAGDSGGTVYLAPNSGKPDSPRFGYTPRDSSALPLKVVRIPPEPGKPPRFEMVSFLNYAMPFACDWDGNGVPDLLLGEGTYSVNTIRLFPDAARASAQSPPREIALYVGQDRTFLAPFAYDWDGDGDLDLFVCDADGRLTAHRRDAASLAAPVDCTFESGSSPLAYCTPQPCDWNADGIMDIIWGEPFGRVFVALGKEKGGTVFAAPFPVRSTFEPLYLRMPQARGRSISLAAVPAREKAGPWPKANGGTADARRMYIPNSPPLENLGGWPNLGNNPFSGLMPGWSAASPPSLESQLQGDDAGKSDTKQVSWGIAPMPGDVWEVVEEPGAPGEGNTLLLRWHDPARNSVFKSSTIAPPQWMPGAAVAIDSGRSGPFAQNFTKGPVTIKFHLRLDGDISRVDCIFKTTWGPLVGGKPPAEGGHFFFSTTSPPKGQWFEVTHTEEPNDTFQRGLDGDLYIMFLGKGEIRIRDVRVFDGN